MVRRVAVCWMALGVLLWQPLALAQPAAGGLDEALAHAALHWLDVGHHHHDHGGDVHLDDSAEAQAHAALDPLGQSALHRHPVASVPGALPEAAPLPPRARAAGPPYLEGPLRPP
jgi:hypothetical protein